MKCSFFCLLSCLFIHWGNGRGWGVGIAVARLKGRGRGGVCCVDWMEWGEEGKG